MNVPKRHFANENYFIEINGLSMSKNEIHNLIFYLYL